MNGVNPALFKEPTGRLYTTYGEYHKFLNKKKEKENVHQLELSMPNSCGECYFDISFAFLSSYPTD